MSNEENEIIIVLNKADLDEGFFRIGFSDSRLTERIKKKLGAESILNVKNNYNSEKVITWTDLRVKASCYSGFLSFRSPRKSGRTLTSEQKEVLRARLAKNKRQKHD